MQQQRSQSSLSSSSSTNRPKDWIPHWFSRRAQEECMTLLEEGGWRFHDLVYDRNKIPLDGSTYIYKSIEFKPRPKFDASGNVIGPEDPPTQYAVYYHKTPAVVLASMTQKAEQSARKRRQ